MSAAIVKFVAMTDMPNRIREIRKEHGWSLEHLASLVGTSITQISELERGLIQLREHWMIRVARALGVKPGDLLLPEHNGASLSPEERNWIERYRAASAEQRDQLNRMADVILPYAPPAKESDAA